VRTGLYRALNFMAGIVAMTVLRLHPLFSHRRRTDDNAVPLIEIDDLDMAVLRAMSAKGPGFALSAPDLAGPFRLRPSQVQHSLDKLSKNKLLVCVIGNTDGYENYRLTDYGHAYLAMTGHGRRSHA
jgi:RIO-like serine/threonine protein kinase